MPWIPFRRSPLLFSVVALMGSIPSLCLALLPSYSGPALQFDAIWLCLGIWLISTGVCLAALACVYRAEKGGAPRDRISLSILILVAAFIPVVALGIKLVSAFFGWAKP
jgi:hypothetical protein